MIAWTLGAALAGGTILIVACVAMVATALLQGRAKKRGLSTKAYDRTGTTLLAVAFGAVAFALAALLLAGGAWFLAALLSINP